MNMANEKVLVVQQAISFFRKGEYSSARACYVEAAKIFGEHLFINNIKICDLRLQQTEEATYSINNIESFLSDSIVLKKDNYHFISELALYNSKDLLEIVLTCKGDPNIDKMKFLVLFEFFDSDGQVLQKVSGMGISAVFDKHFRYFVKDSVVDEDNIQYLMKTHFPSEVNHCKIYIAAVGIADEETITVSINGKFSPHNEAAVQQAVIKKIELPRYLVDERDKKSYEPIIRTSPRRVTKDLYVACILDEFTTECLEHEVNLIRLTQENWLPELKSQNIDFLLVESCWRGNNGNWGTLTKGSGGGKKLGELLKYCKKNGIPSVFWNKEDPPHYDKFSPVAKMFDQVITTDINMIPFYKNDHNIDAHALSFAAQPKIHNPNSVIKRLNKAVFAGSYYGDKPKRCNDFNQLMKQLKQANIDYDIYDRNYHRDIDKFKFPQEYRKNILGNLAADEVWKAHQGYKYQINMNTVQDSRTMFARRVYESLASGTPVISNASIGVKELFGDIVLFSGHRNGLVKKLRELEKSPEKYLELARTGVRKVMRDHTYAHRIQQICSLLNISIDIEYPESIMSVTVKNESEIDAALSLFSRQTAINKHLYIMLENFDSAHNYLNKSTDKISFVMNFVDELYSDKIDFYKNESVLKVNVGDVLRQEDLEDFTYWGKL